MAPKNIQKLIDEADQALYAAYEEIRAAEKIHIKVLEVLTSNDLSDYEGRGDDISEIVDANTLLLGASTTLSIMVNPDDLIVDLENE